MDSNRTPVSAHHFKSCHAGMLIIAERPKHHDVASDLLGPEFVEGLMISGVTQTSQAEWQSSMELSPADIDAQAVLPDDRAQGAALAQRQD